MSDEPTPEAEVQEVVPETPAEAKSGKKSKADKKKPIAQSHPKKLKRQPLKRVARSSRRRRDAANESSAAIEPAAC